MRVTQFIEAAVAGVPADQPAPCPEPSGAKVTFVEDIDRARAMSRWGLNKFVLPDFQFISRCSYFDYQREHVHVRTSPILKARRAARRTGRTNKRLPVNRDYAVVETNARFAPERSWNWTPGRFKGRCRPATNVPTISS